VSCVDVDLSQFVVIANDDNSLTLEAPWGVRSTVSSWHLVDERKLQMCRRYQESQGETT
jgi:hypothetical protein